MSRIASTHHRTVVSAAWRRRPRAPAAVRLDTTLPPILSILTGAGLTLVAVGFLEAGYGLLDDSALTFQICILAMAAAFAFGLRQPYRAALRAGPILQRLLQPVSRADHPQAEVTSRPGHNRWLLAGGAALITGLAALGGPAIISIAHSTLEGASANFCWITPTRIALEALVVLMMAAIPFTCAGLLVRCVHHTWTVEDATSVHRWSWMLTGAAAGLGVLAIVWAGPPPPDTLCRTAAVPLLAAAILAVARTAPQRVRSRTSSRIEPQEPDIDDPWPTVLRLGVGVAAGCAIVAGFNWAQVQSASHASAHRAFMLAGGVLVAALAGGVALAGSRRREADHRIGSFGAQVALIGAAMAAGTSFFAIVNHQSYAPFRETPGHALLWLICGVAPLAALGYATGYGVIAVSRRTDTVGRTSPHVAVRSDDAGLCRFGQKVAITAGAAAAIVAAPLLVRFGSYVSLVAVSLALLACGGILLIHDPTYEPPRRRRRVACVFVTVIVMTALMPMAGQGWLASRGPTSNSSSQVRVLETWSGAYQITPDGQVLVLNADTSRSSVERASLRSIESLDWSRFSQRPRVCIISNTDTHRMPGLPTNGLERHYALDSSVYSASTPSGYWRQGRIQDVRTLRNSRDRFDLIVVSLIDVSPAAATRLLSTGRLRQLAGRLVADGAILVLTPAEAQASTDTAQLARVRSSGRTLAVQSFDILLAGRPCRAWIASLEPAALADIIGAREPRFAERSAPP